MAGIVIILLAAGTSSRMGLPKLLLPVDESGRTMLRKTLDELAVLRLPIITVTGRYRAEIEEALSDGINVQLVHNEDWSGGMSTSIEAGITAAGASPSGFLIALADQPFVTSRQYAALLHAFDASECPLVATAYPEGPGVPAVFAKRYTGELTGVSGRGGAKYLLRGGKHRVWTIDFGTSPVDIDTPEDYLLYTGNSLP